MTLLEFQIDNAGLQLSAEGCQLNLATYWGRRCFMVGAGFPLEWPSFLKREGLDRYAAGPISITVRSSS